MIYRNKIEVLSEGVNVVQQSVIVKYRTRKDYCNCCEQKIPNPKTSELQEFKFNKVDIQGCGYDWKEVVEFEDDLQEIVREYVYDTIRFFATSSYEVIIIDGSEFEKVKQFILNEVV